MSESKPPLGEEQDPLRTAVLERMVRDAERVIDAQMRGIEELDDKGEHLTRMAVLAVILGLAMGSFIVTAFDDARFGLKVWTLAIVGSGLLFSLGSIYFISHSYSNLFGGKRDAFTSPHPADLIEHSKKPGMDLEVHYEGLLMGYSRDEKANTDLMREMTHWRGVGLSILVWVAIPLYVVGMVLTAILALP